MVNRPRKHFAVTERTRGGKTYYVVRVSAGIDALGRRVQPERWCSTLYEAQKARRELERAVEDGASTSSRRRGKPLATYLDEWAKSLTIKTSSVIRYKTAIRSEPFAMLIGNLMVEDLCTSKREGVDRVQEVYRKMRAAGASDSKVRKAHTVLSAALADAVPRIIRGNPCTLIPRRQKPKQNSAERKILTAEQLVAFQAAIVGNRLEAFYAVAFSLMREGEIFALERKDVRLDEGRIYVDKSMTQVEGGKYVVGAPKSRHGVRFVELPQFAIEALARHLEPAELLRRGASGSRLVFPNCRGNPMKNGTLLRAFYQTLERAGLPRVTFHDLRHSIGTSIAHLVPATVLKTQLGHGSLQMTDHYTGHRTSAGAGLLGAALGSVFPPVLGAREGIMRGKAKIAAFRRG